MTILAKDALFNNELLKILMNVIQFSDNTIRSNSFNVLKTITEGHGEFLYHNGITSMRCLKVQTTTTSTLQFSYLSV